MSDSLQEFTAEVGYVAGKQAAFDLPLPDNPVDVALELPGSSPSIDHLIPECPEGALDGEWEMAWEDGYRDGVRERLQLPEQ